MDDPIHFRMPSDNPDNDRPDLMNDPAFEPPQRRDTFASSKHGSEGIGGDTCRICRSEGTPDEPLFYPCKCNGSIKFVHQECLMEWLSHSQKKHCELCKTPFRFTKLYDANMPTTLPWSVFISRACLHSFLSLVRLSRLLLVASVWMVILPFTVRWAWRCMFWFADADWARQGSLTAVHWVLDEVPGPAPPNDTTSIPYKKSTLLNHVLNKSSGGNNTSPFRNPFDAVASGLSTIFQKNTSTSDQQSHLVRRLVPNVSILSSWTYISELTRNPNLNRVILDIFEGQIITCIVITGFILLFLIREWVVQQQPLVNMMDNLNNQQREQDRIEQQRERAQRQLELIEQARGRLQELHDAINADSLEKGSRDDEAPEVPEFLGWDALSALIDSATEHLRAALNNRNEKAYDMFAVSAMDTVRQLRAAQRSEVDFALLVNMVFEKLSKMSSKERIAWEEVFLTEVKIVGTTHAQSHSSSLVHDSTLVDESADIPESSNAARRPPMPNRDSSSRATQIQRLLEEADSTFTIDDLHTTGNIPSRNTTVEPSTETASVISSPSTESSWQHVSPPNEQTQSEQGELLDCVDTIQENHDDIPITNAGPDAKVNIKRSGRPKSKPVVPEPKQSPGLLTDRQLKTILRGGRLEPDNQADADASGSVATSSTVADEHRGIDGDNSTNSQQEPEDSDQNYPRGRAAEGFREDVGFDATDSPADPPQVDADARTDDLPHDEELVEPDTQQAAEASPDLLQRLADWFWGDIQVQDQGALEPAVAPDEEVADAEEAMQEARFVPMQDRQPGIANEPRAELPQENDPEVVAAAQQAGLDAEAIEDAEDLEGIFELIGLQGPLIGLFQTSCFCCFLVMATVWGAVGMPYVWGKLVLSFLGDPWAVCFKIPLQAASFVADLIIDVTLVITGWITVVIALTFDTACQFAFVDKWAPFLTKYSILRWVSEVATTTASSAGQRLVNTIASESETGWNWCFLSTSAHAHRSLNMLKARNDAILDYIGGTITSIAETASSGSLEVLWQRIEPLYMSAALLPAKIATGIKAVSHYTQTLSDSIGTLKSGALTFESSKHPVDLSLVIWNTTDRTLAVLAGYLALVALATVYVAVDKSITPYPTGQKIEKMIRDTLRQAGGVFKVILIISIEMLVFPLYCGLLLDVASLPLFDQASMATRWAFAIKAPYTFGFIHWFVGTCYMFHFALFVGMCRKILRKGVLWFIHDPDDPTFHPVRDVLERNVTTQLRKIAFSALVYGALVILCLGGVIWSIGKVFKGIFPIHWVLTEPVLEFPLDLALYNFLTPLILRLSNPSTAVSAVYSWWLRRCARWLRLSHFLFDDRQKDEEGRHVRRTWRGFFLMRRGDPNEPLKPTDPRLTEAKNLPEIYFRRNGRYVLTPCTDQYKPPKAGEAFLHVDEEDVYIIDKDGNRNPHFAKVYIPPFFKFRVTLFMVCLWIFSAFAGLCATLVPLVFGRTIFSAILPHGTRVNDIYSYSVGAYILATVFVAALKGSSGVQYAREKLFNIDWKARTQDAMRYSLQAAKCLYVYGFMYVVIPSFFVLVLQLYLVLPLHTYAVATLRPALESPTNATANATEPASMFLQGVVSNSGLPPKLAEHSIHILADFALCLVYLRIALRWVVQSPASRAAEAIRRITADGYLNPNARLTTRFFIVPALVVAAVLLLAPPGLIRLAMAWIRYFHDRAIDEVVQTLLYRYSYPVTAGAVFLALGSIGLARATSRWRSRIRDEVYLVGERLHNFGERKPPTGSKSVVRKER